MSQVWQRYQQIESMMITHRSLLRYRLDTSNQMLRKVEPVQARSSTVLPLESVSNIFRMKQTVSIRIVEIFNQILRAGQFLSLKFRSVCLCDRIELQSPPIIGNKLLLKLLINLKMSWPKNSLLDCLFWDPLGA